jgi:hypothetical protein
MTFPTLCSCGRAILLDLDQPAAPVRCEACGSGTALVTELKHFVWSIEDGQGEWVEAEGRCESCGKALLANDMDGMFPDVTLCKKCGAESRAEEEGEA